jgi:putative ABC transport system permease protein
MYQSKTRVRFDRNSDPEAVEAALEKRFPEAGLDIRTRDRASPGAERFVSRMGEFLTLVGLAALIIAGIGIGGGVASYLEARRASIATLKILGATSGDIARIYALQIGAAAIAGALAGLVAGVLVTPLLAQSLGELLPVRKGLVIDPAALSRGVLFGMPRGAGVCRAAVDPGTAFSGDGADALARGAARGRLAGRSAAGRRGACRHRRAGADRLAAARPQRDVSRRRRCAARLPGAARQGNPPCRSACATAIRPDRTRGACQPSPPGAATGALVTALGFGLSAFVLLAAVQTSLDGNIRRSVPARAPDYFVLDIPRDRLTEFRAMVLQQSSEAKVEAVPTLRGAILAYGPKDHPTVVSQLEELPEGAWALRGERGLTYAESLPEGNSLVAGDWWPANYAGEPLVSVDADLARAAGLRIGDYLTVGLLGVERRARIANLRRIDWESMGFNYVLVFSPNAIEGRAAQPCRHRRAASGPRGRRIAARPRAGIPVEFGDRGRPAADPGPQHPGTGLARDPRRGLGGGAGGNRGAARRDRGGARGADLRHRDPARARGEHAPAAGAAARGVRPARRGPRARRAGAWRTAAWLVIVQLFEFEWLPDWPRVFAVLGAGIALVLAFALGASLPLLRARPARALRSL